MSLASGLPRPARLPSFRLGRIERYVTRQSLIAVGGALSVIIAIVMLIDFVDISRTVGARVDMSMLQIVALTLLKSPSVVLLLLPFAFLFGVLTAFVSLNRRSELIALRASGVSAWRFIFPAATAAFLLGIATISALNPIAAWLNSEYERETAGIATDLPTGSNKEIWLRQGDGRTQVVVEARTRDPGTTRLRNVSMYVYSRSDRGLEFSRRIDAQTAVLSPGYWRLTGAREAVPGEPAVPYETLTIPSSLNPNDAFARLAAPTSVPFWALPREIAKIERAGFSATGYRLRFHQLLATPLLFAAMSILGAAFSLRLMRPGHALDLRCGAGIRPVLLQSILRRARPGRRDSAGAGRLVAAGARAFVRIHATLLYGRRMIR
jgi:lipopolysaccharide export system permease protein